MQFQSKGYNKGKVVYWIDGKRFENTNGKRDGKAKAEAYCLDSFLNPADIQKFDSRTECDRYEFLLERSRIGEIDNLGHHFTLRVQDEFTNSNGDLIPAITYEADFIYRDTATGQRVVEDVKGSEYFIDERFLTLKQVFDKLMLGKGLYIKVVLHRGKEWVEWHMGEKKKSQKLLKKQREELSVLRQAQHMRMVQDNTRAREQARYTELRDKVAKGQKLTSAQRKRLEELRAKFEI